MVNRSLLITFWEICGILLSVLYEDLDKLVRQRKTVDSHLQISEKRIFDFRVASIRSMLLIIQSALALSISSLSDLKNSSIVIINYRGKYTASFCQTVAQYDSKQSNLESIGLFRFISLLFVYFSGANSTILS